MEKKNRNMNVIIIAAVLLIVIMTGLCIRLLHRLTISPADPSANNALSSGETAVSTENTADTGIAAETPSVSYPAESLPDYEVHTLPVTTAETTAEESETSPPETTIVPEHTESSESNTLPETTSEPKPEDSPTEFSENSDNLKFIGIWRLEYDLGPAQSAALAARYDRPRVPDRPVILHISAVLADDGKLRVIYAQEDADAFKSALSDWYAEAAAIYAETGANSIRKAAFSSWAAYRKGLYALLSPDTVNRLEAGWYAEGDRIFITDEGEVQAELSTASDSDGLNITAFRVLNPDFRDTVAAMQETLGVSPPFHLTKD